MPRTCRALLAPRARSDVDYFRSKITASVRREGGFVVVVDSARPLLGQHAVVTGGGSGIGAAGALDVARLGARLTLIGRRPDKLTAQARAIQDATSIACAAVPPGRDARDGGPP